MKLAVISSPPKEEKPKPDLSILLVEAYLRNINQYAESKDRSALKRIVYYGIRFFLQSKYQSRTLAETENLFKMGQQIKRAIALITPRELMEILPIDKHYDGARYESKDYFHTIEVLKKHGMDTIIGDEVENVIWDYHNMKMRVFYVSTLSLLDKLRRAEGKPSMIEEFFGIQPWTMHTDQKGKQYMVQKGTGEIRKVMKKRPRYLKAIK